MDDEKIRLDFNSGFGLRFIARWGNMAFFYHDHGYSQGLLPVGRVEEGGISKLAAQKDDFTARLEKADAI